MLGCDEEVRRHFAELTHPVWFTAYPFDLADPVHAGAVWRWGMLYATAGTKALSAYRGDILYVPAKSLPSPDLHSAIRAARALSKIGRIEGVVVGASDFDAEESPELGVVPSCPSMRGTAWPAEYFRKVFHKCQANCDEGALERCVAHERHRCPHGAYWRAHALTLPRLTATDGTACSVLGTAERLRMVAASGQQVATASLTYLSKKAVDTDSCTPAKAPASSPALRAWCKDMREHFRSPREKVVRAHPGLEL